MNIILHEKGEIVNIIIHDFKGDTLVDIDKWRYKIEG